MPSYGISELASGLQNRQDYSGMITPAEHKAVLEGEVTCQHMLVAVHVWGDYCFFFFFFGSLFCRWKLLSRCGGGSGVSLLGESITKVALVGISLVPFANALSLTQGCFLLCILLPHLPMRPIFFFYPGFLKKPSTGCCSAFMCDARQ